MAINRRHFAARFSQFPPWKCPSCRDGTLARIKDIRKVLETGPSKKAHGHEAWDPDWIIERFIDLLKCSNTSCEELVSVSGHTQNSLDYFYGPTGETETELNTYLVPTGFDPAPMIIAVSEKTPDEIQEVLKAAFSLYWLDKEACANKLRISVELLMDDIKIPSTRKGKDGRERPLTLDSRLREFSSISSEPAELLLAVKWIGNAGSHANLSRLDADDLLDVFEILEWVLEETYTGTRKRLAAIASEINSAKGKPVRHRRTRKQM